MYVSAWIKRFHPAAFAAALLNSQPMGFYAPAQLVRDAREHGVEVRPIDVNFSDWDCTLEYDVTPFLSHAEHATQRHRGTEISPRDFSLFFLLCESSVPLCLCVAWIRARIDGDSQSSAEPSPCPLPAYRERGRHKSTWGIGGPALRLGFRQIKGMRQDDADRIVAARNAQGEFDSVAELQHAAKLSTASLHRLATADTLSSIALNRRHATWEAMALSNESMPLFDGVPDEAPAEVPALPPMHPGEEVVADYTHIGLSLKKHPVSFARAALEKYRVVPASAVQDVARFPQGKRVSVAGLVLVRQRPGTASGVVFITLEDESGVVNLILWSSVYDRYRKAARHATLLQCDGIVQREGKVIHVLAKRLTDRTPLLAGISQASRDFH